MAVAVQDAVPGAFVLKNIEDHGPREYDPTTVLSLCTQPALQTIPEPCASGGGMCPETCHKAAIFDIQLHRRRFEANFKGDIVEELQQRHPQLRDPKALEAFRRKWQYLFVYAEVGFARAYATLNCWTFVRPVSTSTETCCMVLTSVFSFDTGEHRGALRLTLMVDRSRLCPPQPAAYPILRLLLSVVDFRNPGSY